MKYEIRMTTKYEKSLKYRINFRQVKFWLLYKYCRRINYCTWLIKSNVLTDAVQHLSKVLRLSLKTTHRFLRLNCCRFLISLLWVHSVGGYGPWLHPLWARYRDPDYGMPVPRQLPKHTVSALRKVVCSIFVADCRAIRQCQS